MVGRTPHCSRINTFKPKYTQVELVDENVDHSDWIFFGYVIVQALRQKRHLRPSLTFDESLHDRGIDQDFAQPHIGARRFCA